ncbi:MAG TPA: cytochrome c oxidase subunit 4 [Acidimicrobiales bacterium]|nr:cytochrome c oxidase subunit 4 [Acidimicrobiales bacterium]
MKSEARLLLVVSLFGAAIGALFWAVGLNPVYATITSGGTIMLGAVCLLGLLPGYYYHWWSRRMTPRAEDDPEATPESGAGVIGVFPGSSIWPFVLGLSALLVCLSLVFGFWTAIFGFSLALAAVVGVILESRRGGAI